MLDSILITNDDGIEAPGLAVFRGKKDQDQAIEISRFLAGETGGNRRTKAEAAMISSISGALERMRPGYKFMVCSGGAPRRAGTRNPSHEQQLPLRPAERAATEDKAVPQNRGENPPGMATDKHGPAYPTMGWHRRRPVGAS
jgi:hypothetical protein